MKFSLLYLPCFDDAVHDGGDGLYRQIFEEVDFAEAAGFDTAWFAEHHFSHYGGCLPNVPLMLAALAQRTRRIRLGTGGICLPLHKPVEIAEQLAMVDVVSGGRLRAGLVRAFLAYEYEGYNVDMGESRERFNEAVDIITGLWRNKYFSYEGKFSQLKNVRLRPQPLQKPPPITIGTVQTRESFEYAGRHGFDLMIVPYVMPIEDMAERIGWYHQALAEAGHNPAERNIMAGYHFFCDRDGATARDVPRDGLLGFLRSAAEATRADSWSKDYAGYQGMSERMESLMDYEMMYRERTLFGTPAQIFDKLEAVAKAGITEVALITNLPALPHERVMGSLNVLGEDLLPTLRQNSMLEIA